MKKVSYYLGFGALIILAILILLPSFMSGVIGDGSIRLHTGHDVLWHMSIAAEAKRGLPLIYPGMDGVILNNYYYFTDLLIGYIHILTSIPLFTLYYRIIPALLISLLIWRIYKLSFLLSQHRFASIFATISALISSSAGFLLPIFTNRNKWNGGAFMLSPTYTQLVNPHSILGFVIFFWGIYYYVLSTKRHQFYNLLKATILFSILFAVKTFYALPVLILVVFISLIKFKKNNDTRYLINPMLSITMVLFIYLIVSGGLNLNSKALEIRPGWLLVKMIENSERFPQPEMILKRLHYLSTNNMLRIWQQNIKLLIIFILGNFWIKLAGIYLMIRSEWKDEIKIFFSFLILLSIALTLIIVPNPDHFNAMQFGRTATIIVSWLFGLFVAIKFNKIIAFILILISTMVFWGEYFQYTIYSSTVIQKSEYSANIFIKNNTAIDSQFLIDTKKGNLQFYVSGIGERRTYFDDYKVSQLIGVDYLERSRLQKQFFNNEMNSTKITNFLRTNNIDYIYTYQPNTIIDTYEITSLYFENDTIMIYKVH